ncbi:hypothetical protein HGB07_05910 [Candidatus Roizmanbacteria bacterium]|nr:hypothetical protein [Candidatus Roizmanbacteria bacterium]
MVFKLQKVSDYGTSNYIVARTSVQISELLRPIQLEKEKDEKICELFFMKIQPRLIRCYEISNKISGDLEKIDADLKENGIKTQSAGRVVEVPHVMQLTEDVETYLYNAKSVLRDLAVLFEIFFNKKFDHSRYSDILKWAKEYFEKDHPITKFIEANQPWLKDIVQRRNAVEHPGGYSGHLHIKNIEFVEDKENSHFAPPTWHLNENPPTPIHNDIQVILRNILEFSEILFVLILQTIESPFPLKFYEIPEKEREEKAPVRFGVTIDLNNFKIKKNET